jgi:RNA polymerase-binding transcription factor DksA
MKKNDSEAKERKMMLEKYKKILLERQIQLAQHIQAMEKSVLESPMRDATGDLTNLPTHIADISTDTFSQNLAIELLAGEEGVMKEIAEALDRIEGGTFGICEHCNQEIPPKRLEHIPFARLCVKCKGEDEKRNSRTQWNAMS